MDDESEEINSSIVVATLVGKLQELLAHAVECAMHTPDYFFNVVRYEKSEVEATRRRSSSNTQLAAQGFSGLVDKDKRIWLNFPRNCWFYDSSVKAIVKASRSLPETAINMIIEWLPKQTTAPPARPSSPRQNRQFSYENFMSMVVGFTMHSDPKVLDMVESAVELAVADVISHSLSQGVVSKISSPTIAKLKDLVFFYNKPTSPRVASNATWPIVRANISEQWQVILSEISVVSLGASWAQFTKLIVSSTPEDAINHYKIFRWAQLSSSPEDSKHVENVLMQFNLWLEANKKTASRHALLETVETILQSIDFSNNAVIFEKVKPLYNRAIKSCKNDDLEGPAMKLIATILARSPYNFFEEELDNFLQKRVMKLIGNVKKKDAVLEVLLRVLRGKYMPPRKSWTPQDVPYTGPNPFAFLGVGGNKAKMMSRLQEIIQGLFGKKQVLPKVMESVEVLSYIVAQIAAHNLKYTMNTVLPLLFLDTTPSPIHHSIGLRSLYLILDPALGFWQNAPSALLKTTDSEYVSHKDVLVTFESYLVRLFRICDEQAGPDVLAYEAIQLTSSLDPHPSLFAPPMFESPPLNTIDITDFRNKVAVEAVKRWHNVCTKPADVRTTEFDNTSITMNQKVVLILKKWGSDTNLTIPPPDSANAADAPFAGKTKKKYRSETNLISSTTENSPVLDPGKLHPIRKHSKKWGSDPNLVDNPPPFLTTEDNPEKAKVRKKIKRKTMNLDFLEVYKQVIKCVTLVPANVREGDHSFARLLLHEDDELVNITSHTLQDIIKEHPQYRSPIVQGLVTVLSKHDPLDTYGQHTLVEHLAGVLDLWNECVLAENYAIMRAMTTPHPLPDGSYPNPQLVNEVEAIALTGLCSPNAHIRWLSLQILKAIYALGRQDNCIAKIMDSFSKDMLQRARFRLLLDSAYGVDQSIQFNPGSASFLPTIEEVSMSVHNTFWTYVLAELGRVAVDQECVRTLTILRNTLQHQISVLPPLPLEPANDEQRKTYGFTYKQLWTNYHALYFAINGTHSKSPSLFVFGSSAPATSSGGLSNSGSLAPPSSSLTSPTFNAEANQEISVFEQAVLTKLNTYLGGFWVGLLSDVGWVRNAVTTTCALAHWRAMPTVIDSLAKWYNQNRQNKKKPKLRTEIACVFRRVAQEPKFSLALTGSGDMHHIYNSFIQETEPIFGDETKIPIMENTWYFMDHALVVYYFANAIFTSVPCATRGPVRLTLVPSVTSGANALYKIFKTLVQWSGHAKTQESAELAKRHSRMVKDTVSRDGIKNQFEKTLQQVAICARLASESVSRLCPLSEENLHADVLNWVVEAEQNGSRILRWLLSFHFDHTAKLFFDKSYTAPPAESVLYLHAIYDQFLPILVPPPPTDGVTQWANDYYKRKANEEHQQALLESAVRTTADVNFSSKLTENAPKILHLALFNLAHPAALARLRAYELIHRLGPGGFGRSASEDDSLRIKLFPYKVGVQSRLAATSHTSALQVSAITSANKECSLWSEELFREAFSRFENMNAGQRKWAIQFLLPWCDNILLDEKQFNLKAYSTASFLNSVFTQFTKVLSVDANEIPQEMFDLWLRLASRPENLTVIVSFLLRKGITDRDSMPICKAIILHLFCKSPELTLAPLVYQLSLPGVQAGHKEDNDPSETPVIPNKPMARTIDPKQIAKQSYMLREAAVNILTDLIPESLSPFLSHIHILVNYCFLRIDSSENQILTRMLIVLISALRTTLHVTKKTSEHAPLATALETSLLALRAPNFKLKWNLSYSSDSSEEPFSTCVLPTTPDTHSKMLMRWCMEEVYVSEFVDMLCQCFSVISKDSIEKWGTEALDWARGYRDLRLSIKGFQLYRAIPKKRTSNDISLLMSSLVEAEEKMEGALLNIAKWSSDNAKSHTHRFQVEEGIAQLTRAKCLEILLALKQIVPVLKSDTQSLSNIFWASVAFMPPNHFYFTPLYQQALEVLLSLKQVGFFENAAHLAERANTLEFKRGIQPYLFKGLFGTPRSEKTSARLMIMCYSTKENSAFIVDPSPARYPLVILGLLPWFYTKRNDPDTKQICNDLLQTISKGGSTFKAPKIEEALKFYIAGNYDSCPDDFLARVCEQFKALCLPKFYPEFSELLTSFMKIAPAEMCSTIVKITRHLLSKDSLTYFRDICKMCSDRIASVPFAEALLLDVVSLAPKEEITTPLAPVRDESQKLKYTCVLLRQVAGTVSGVVLHDPTTNAKVRRVKHRRNRSGITDHPSLQRNIEQTVIPAYTPAPPEYAKLFETKQPSTSSTSSSTSSTPSTPSSASTREPVHTPGATPPSAGQLTSISEETKGDHTGDKERKEAAAARRRSKGAEGDDERRRSKGGEEEDGARRRSKGGDEDEDSDFEEEIDPYLINNDLDPITPQTPRAASRAGWDDGYNSYLDENSQQEVFSLDDLKKDLEGLDDKLAQFADVADSNPLSHSHYNFPELESLMRADSFQQLPTKRGQTLRIGGQIVRAVPAPASAPAPAQAPTPSEEGESPIQQRAFQKFQPARTHAASSLHDVTTEGDVRPEESLGDLRKGLEGITLNFDGPHTHSVDGLNHDSSPHAHIQSIVATPSLRQAFLTFLRATDPKAVREVGFVESVLDFISLSLSGTESEILNAAKRIVEKYIKGDLAIALTDEYKQPIISDFEKGNTHGIFDKAYNHVLDRLGDKWLKKFQQSPQFAAVAPT